MITSDKTTPYTVPAVFALIFVAACLSGLATTDSEVAAPIIESDEVEIISHRRF